MDERWVHDFVDHVYLGNRYICEVCGYTLNQG
jgi:rubrerythrin